MEQMVLIFFEEVIYEDPLAAKYNQNLFCKYSYSARRGPSYPYQTV